MGILDVPGISRSQADNLYPLKSQVVAPGEIKRRRLSTTKVIASWKLYQSGHNFTPTGGGLDAAASNMNDTSDVIRGSQSLKLVTSNAGGNATAEYSFGSSPVDLSGASAIRLYLKYSIAVAGQFVDLFMGKSNFGFYFNNNKIVAGGGGAEGTNFPWQAGRWEIVDIPLSEFGQTGTAPTWTDISRIAITVGGPAGTPCTLRVASIEAIAKDPFNAGPVIIPTFDDTLLSQKTVCAPDLNSRGWPATLYPIIDQIQPVTQGASNWDFPWMKSMYDTYGWEIGAHAYSAAAHGVSMSSMTVDQRIAELESIQSWQDANGFAARTFAWPIGNHNRAAEDTVREYYTAALTATRLLNESVSPPRRFAIQRCNVGYESTASVQTAITNTVKDKGLLVLCIHDVTAGAPDTGGNSTSPAKWAAVLSAMQTAVAAGARVTTFDNFISNIR
ncbi:hypothetical protein E4P29_25400 [Rhodococcus sp. 1R11]|uniref:polysaccharide deacetylase family protein n=1 Tax=Rhodococcus sp. 1R11 TaxID=2559614 RepID=UPI0010723B22|nr:polysaccharide deacetylase family protein [Rhodococcus sp. 1R11]TFI40250.1 hypothetical protein E4P29_25400 [Rhodococcus sp. 1R11]